VAQRRIEFSSAVTLGEPLVLDASWAAGLRLQSRWFPGYHSQLGPLVSLELGADERNPERLRAFETLGLGLLGGAHHDLLDVVTLEGNLRGEWLNVWGLPDGTRTRDVHAGLRLGLEAALIYWVGRIWCHAVSLELRAAELVRFGVGHGAPARGFQGSLGFGAVMLPEGPVGG
jgi:hypothetical protein